MKILKTSYFKDDANDKAWFQNWVNQVEIINNKQYQKIQIETSLGKTQVYGLNTTDDGLETLVIFPGARTTALLWDLDNGLSNLGHKFKIYLVETNGLPNLSDGNTPDIKSLGYGEWASEVFNKLNISNAYITGAAFGALVCMKLCLVNPQRVNAAILLNAACLQSPSFTFENIYYRLLANLFPGEKAVRKILENVMFYKPNHQLSDVAEKMLVDYEVFALSRYKDNTPRPYYMNTELTRVKSDIYLLEGGEDILSPFKVSIENASLKLNNLIDVKVFEKAGHCIETYGNAISYIGHIIKERELAKENVL